VSNTQGGPDFEQAFRELESLVERLERGDLTLEDSLQAYERGLALHRACQQTLDGAQRKVEILTRKDGAADTGPFETDDRPG
jgi:exodeoxyribonuclease VII small subunit